MSGEAERESGGSAERGPLESPNHCPGWKVTPEELAHWFHDEYERMAPDFGYKTREASAVPWADVPEGNRLLMIAVAISVLGQWFPEHASIPFEIPHSGRDVTS